MTDRAIRACAFVFCCIAGVAALSAHDWAPAVILGGAAFYLERRMRWR